MHNFFCWNKFLLRNISNSAVIETAVCFWLLCTMWPCFATLCSLTLHCRVVVVLKHFAIIPLTFYHVKCRSEECFYKLLVSYCRFLLQCHGRTWINAAKHINQSYSTGVLDKHCEVNLKQCINSLPPQKQLISNGSCHYLSKLKCKIRYWCNVVLSGKIIAQVHPSPPRQKKKNNKIMRNWREGEEAL